MWVRPQEVQSHSTLHSVSRARFTLIYNHCRDYSSRHTYTLTYILRASLAYTVCGWAGRLLKGKKTLVWLARIATYRPFFFFVLLVGHLVEADLFFKNEVTQVFSWIFAPQMILLFKRKEKKAYWKTKEMGHSYTNDIFRLSVTRL